MSSTLPAGDLLADATLVKGRFPRTGRPGDVMKRVDRSGNTTHYQVYGADGLPVKRVDLVGAAHGGVSTPHVVEYTVHANPATGERFVRAECPRPAHADEVP